MLENILQKLSFINPQEKIAVALSGGSDSHALVEILLDLKRSVIALIVDHQLRVESRKEALLVKSWMENKCSVEILTWQEGKAVTKNLQAAAREARYQLLIDYCQKHQIKFLATAHHKEDQAETLLLNILRGTGIEGLVGIRERSERQGIMLLRPLLDLRKSQLQNYLLAKQLVWIEDPSNDKMNYERVKVRKILLQLEKSSLLNGDKILDRLSLLQKNAIRNQDFLEDYVNKILKQILIQDYKLVKILNWKLLKIEKDEVIFRILKKILGKKVRLSGIENLYLALKKKVKSTLGGYSCQILQENLVIVVERKSKEKEYFLQKNQLCKIRTLLLQGFYKEIDEKSCYETLTLVKSFPRLDFFSSLPYQIIGNNIIIPDLGIALDRLKLD